MGTDPLARVVRGEKMKRSMATHNAMLDAVRRERSTRLDLPRPERSQSIRFNLEITGIEVVGTGDDTCRAYSYTQMVGAKDADDGFLTYPQLNSGLNGDEDNIPLYEHNNRLADIGMMVEAWFGDEGTFLEFDAPTRFAGVKIAMNTTTITDDGKWTKINFSDTHMVYDTDAYYVAADDMFVVNQSGFYHLRAVGQWTITGSPTGRLYLAIVRQPGAAVGNNEPLAYHEAATEDDYVQECSCITYLYGVDGGPQGSESIWCYAAQTHGASATIGSHDFAAYNPASSLGFATSDEPMSFTITRLEPERPLEVGI